MARHTDKSTSRFREPPDPRFWRLNRSIDFDRHLAPYDVAQSRAHAAALNRIGVIADDEIKVIDEGLARIADELNAGEFSFDQGDEDIHMAVERRLGELVGDLAGKLHTGRSRNDQVATDICMAVMDAADGARQRIATAMNGLLQLAESHRDWTMPGYTHLQRAQPVYLGHHLLSWFWMLSRDFERFAAARRAAAVMPLGAGALAGVNWEIDRRRVAADLGFESVTVNSLDSTSNRDMVLDYLSAGSICLTHLSRIGSELVIWSSTEFSFCQLSEPFTSGSSIMPQKQNPDSAELLRAKAPRVIGDFTTLLGVLHALPLTYGKDMQEDKEPFFDAVETVEATLEMTAGIFEGIEFDRERLSAAASDEMLAATEIADLLVRRGVPFREAHGIVGDLVRQCVAEGRNLSDLSQDELASRSADLDEEYYEVLQQGSWLESKVSEGGTSSASLAAQIDLAKARLREIG
ncbi:MAG TPA: argininosuccinate lyase [Solirubrobacterales bacterium]|nr:argininosuccinate lyase [Solirubrobacterales bacterium]HNO97988.1 argininosuccinate lyase [Solirubrobacterales bacterium]